VLSGAGGFTLSAEAGVLGERRPLRSTGRPSARSVGRCSRRAA